MFPRKAPKGAFRFLCYYFCMQKFLKFPDGFWWGAATSSHQVEGNTHNNWSEWEQSPRRIADLKQEGKNPKDFISGRGADQYHLYEKDFDIAKKLGHTMHRLSIEWSRIEPEEGKFDERELEHYRMVIDALRERGIEPMVTLYHWTEPLWFSKRGGFLHPDAPQAYKRFISRVVDNLKDRVGVWITFNEATTVLAGMAYKRGIWPPQYRSLWKFLQFRRAIVKAHILAYREIKKIYSSLDVSRAPYAAPIMSHNIKAPFVGAVENNTCFKGGRLIRALGIEWAFNRFYNEYLWSRTLPYQDFLGLNYYTLRRLPGSHSAVPETGHLLDQLGWEVYPQGIYERLMALKRFGKPIFITENGLYDSEDHYRGQYIKDHLRWIWQAIQDDTDVRGYLHWSLIDNFEWHHGFQMRFGLVEVDYETLERRIRPSAHEYAKIIQDNGLE